MTSTYDTVRYRSLHGAGVLVTGGASGIGADLVRAFASQGAQVRFLDIDEAAGAALAAEVPGSSFRACDLRDIEALRDAVRATERAFAIDVLVNNAARDDRHDMFDVEPEDWRRTLAVNLDHQFFATQAVARHMRERKRGSIVLTSSISWMRGRPGMVGYTASKAAIHGMNKTLARELGGSRYPGQLHRARRHRHPAPAGAVALARGRREHHARAGAEAFAGCDARGADGAVPGLGGERGLHRRQLRRRRRADAELMLIEATEGGFSLVLDGRVVVRHSPEAPFVSVGRGRERMEMYRGNFDISDDVLERRALAHAEIDGDRLRFREGDGGEVLLEHDACR